MATLVNALAKMLLPVAERREKTLDGGRREGRV
jgi:hypothetical protein